MARFQCPSCATWQESAELAEGLRCILCDAALDGDTTPAPPRAVFGLTPDENVDVFDLGAGEGRFLDELSEKAHGTRPAEVDEILDDERRWVALSSLIPVWGIWRVSRSEHHSASQRLALVCIAVLATLLVPALVWWAQPSRAERTAAVRDEVAAGLASLRDLIEQYRRQYGRYPDAEAWARSAGPNDRRFVDPWGSLYVYEADETGFRVGTYGSDGAPGGAGAAADVFARFEENGR